MDDFEIVDKNGLEIDINELNLDITCDITNNDFSPDKEQGFSIISEVLKNEDVGNVANNIESDSTSPLSIENIDLSSETVENINHESMNYESYPLTMLSVPLGTLVANNENLDKDNLLSSSFNVNEENESKNSEKKFDSITENVLTNITSDVNEETNSIRVSEKLTDVTVTSGNELLSKEDEPDFRVNIIERNDSEDKWSTNTYIHNDNIVKPSNNLSEIEEKKEKGELDSERSKIDEKKEEKDKLDNGRSKIDEKKEMNELINNVDEPDFRVNIIERNDSEDKWSTNAYIHNDNIVKPSNNLSEIVEKKEEKNELDSKMSKIDEKREEINKLDSDRSKIEEKKEERNELINNEDEPDFRVNIIERNDSEDKWSTNHYIHNDNILKPSNNLSEIDEKKEKGELDSERSKIDEKKEEKDELDSERSKIDEKKKEKDELDNGKSKIDEKKEEKGELDSGISKIDEKKKEKDELDSERSKIEEKNEIINNADEPDFRVNIIERNGSEDKWLVSTFTPDSNVNKEISSDIERNEKQSLNSEINNSNLEVLKSDSVESSQEINTSNNIESDSKNNECINSSNGNENVEIKQELGNQKNENEIVLCQENMNIEINDQSERRVNEVIEESQRGDIRNNEVSTDTKTPTTESVIIRPLGVDDPVPFPGMSALIHMLFNCVEFRKKMIEYHNTDQIAYFDLESNVDIKSEDLLFINDLCKLFVVMKQNNLVKIREVGQSIRRYFRNIGVQLSANKGFDYILEKTNTITRTVSNENNMLIKEEDIAFFNYKCLNKSFVSDLFSCQIMTTTFCCKCQSEHGKTFEHLRYLSLKIPKEKSNLNLENCIQNLFNEVKIETSNNYNCCTEPDVKLKRKLTHIPEYLFIYLDRKLENNERDNIFVETDNGIFLESENGIVLYSLCSVIDELFVNQTFLNIVKCLSDAWWIIDYMNCRKIAPFEIVTGNSIGFMFKKQID